MTITNENRKTDLVIDSASLFTFSYTFDIIAEDTVDVDFFDTDGVEVSVTMVRTTSSSPAANEFFVDKDNSQVKFGGSGTLQSQYGVTITQLLITRTVDLTQAETFPTATNLQADAIETALDKNTMATQQLSETVDRALVIPIQDDTSQVVDLPAASVRANKFLAFDSDGNPTAAVSTEGSVTVSTTMEPFIAAATFAAARTLLDVYSKSETYTQTEADAITDALATLIAANLLDTTFEVEHAANGTHDLTKFGFVDRGDPAAADFEVGDLTTDGTWKDLDLATIVGDARVRSVLIHVKVQDGAVSSLMQFRKKGNADVVARSAVRTQVANIINEGTFIVPCSTAQVIQYHGSNLTFSTIEIIVLGWFI